MSTLYLQSVGVLGPGLPDWPTTRRILSGEAPYDAQVEAQPNPMLLPPNERRRVPRLVRWTIAAAHEALIEASRDPADVAVVFTSSSGDGEIVHRLCEAAASPAREVSPTLFHNSVHNAPAGYWSIGAGSQQRSVALCGHDASFAVGLMEAVTLVCTEQVPVLLVACDLPFPEPLAALRPIGASFAVALLLSPVPCRQALACWQVSIGAGAEATAIPAALPATLATNPAAAALPLLAASTRDAAETVRLTYVGGQHLAVEVRRCH